MADMDLRYIQEMSEMKELEALPGDDSLNLLQNTIETGFGVRRSESMWSEAREDLIRQILNKRPKTDVY